MKNLRFYLHSAAMAGSLTLASVPALAADAAAPAAAGPAATAPAPQAAPPATPAENSYSVGLSVGTELRAGGLENRLVLDDLMRGVKAGLAGTEATSADKMRVIALVREIQTERAAAQAALAAKNHAAAREFLDRNGKEPGVVTTASGLQYKVLAAGKAGSANAKASDTVSVNYRGQLLDGTEFDSSYKRGQPATFPVSGVIPGWTEALQLMKPGAKYELFIPAELAYGDNARQGSPIPPGSLLKFEVELLSIAPAPKAVGGTKPGAPKVAAKSAAVRKAASAAAPAAAPAKAPATSPAPAHPALTK